MKGALRIGLILLAAAAAPGEAWAQKTVFLVRHGEKTTPTSDELSAEGRARADRLARTLRSAQVSVIVTTDAARTRQTAEPLARALGLTPVTVPLSGLDAARREAAMMTLANTLRTEHASAVVLVVGHSDTTPMLIKAMRGPADIVIDEPTEFDNLFVLAPRGAAAAPSFIRLRY